MTGTLMPPGESPTAPAAYYYRPAGSSAQTITTRISAVLTTALWGALARQSVGVDHEAATRAMLAAADKAARFFEVAEEPPLDSSYPDV